MIAELEQIPDAEAAFEALGPGAELVALPYAAATFEALGPVAAMEQIE